MNKYEKALKVIDKAVGILKEKEWIQFQLAIDNKDNPIYFVESKNIGNIKGCCLAGALCLAHTNETNAVILVNSHINKVLDDVGIAEFNDTPGRTKRQIFGFFKKLRNSIHKEMENGK